jgi:hypothetical protein
MGCRFGHRSNCRCSAHATDVQRVKHWNTGPASVSGRGAADWTAASIGNGRATAHASTKARWRVQFSARAGAAELVLSLSSWRCEMVRDGAAVAAARAGGQRSVGVMSGAESECACECVWVNCRVC